MILKLRIIYEGTFKDLIIDFRMGRVDPLREEQRKMTPILHKLDPAGVVNCVIVLCLTVKNTVALQLIILSDLDTRNKVSYYTHYVNRWLF